jgi:hypothetical protein
MAIDEGSLAEHTGVKERIPNFAFPKCVAKEYAEEPGVSIFGRGLIISKIKIRNG